MVLSWHRKLIHTPWANFWRDSLAPRRSTPSYVGSSSVPGWFSTPQCADVHPDYPLSPLVLRGAGGQKEDHKADHRQDAVQEETDFGLDHFVTKEWCKWSGLIQHRFCLRDLVHQIGHRSSATLGRVFTRLLQPGYKLLPKNVQHKDQHGMHDGLRIIIFYEAYQGPWEGLCLIHVLNQMLAVVDHRPQAILPHNKGFCRAV